MEDREVKPRRRRRVRRVKNRRSDWWLKPTRFAVLRATIQTVALAALLHFNATHFDSGEIKSIAGASLVTVILEAVGIRRHT